MNPIAYKKGNDLDLDEVIELYRASNLGERRPVHNREVMKGMMENADLVITAWDGSKLIGISRTLTDFWRVAYLADLAIDQDYQKNGIGKELIKRTRDALKPTCSIVLLSASKTNEYYSEAGFEHNAMAWTLDPKTNL